MIAAFIFSITPAVVYWSHCYAKPFAFALFWMILSLFMCLKLFNQNNNKSYILAGLSAGFVASSVLTYGFIFFSIPIIQFFKNSKKGIRIAFLSLVERKMWLALIFFIIGFFITNPHWIPDFKYAFADLKGVRAQYPFSLSISRFFYYLRHTLLSAFGFPELLLMICGIIYT